MLATIHASRKIWYARFVTRWVWAELAVWSTRRSALQGWRAERTRAGLYITTPLVGLAVALWIGDNPPGTRYA